MPSALGPTPITATHRLELHVNVPGARDHLLRYYVNAVPSGDPDGFNFTAFGGGARSMSDAVGDILAILRPMWRNDVQIGNFVLQQYSAGAWLPVSSDTANGNGTSSNPTQATQQLTYSLRDSAGRPMRSILLETGFPALIGKFLTMTALGGPWGAYGDSLVDHSVNHLGFFIRSRGGNFTGSVISAVLDSNDKLRRERGDS